jgi:hypothetical protein
MRVAYISGSYRSNSVNGIYENIQKARDVAMKYWRLGYAVICPHTNTAFMDGACPDHVWLDGDLELVRRSDIVVMLPGWQSSEGSIKEYQEAVENDKEIIEEQ